MAARVEIQAKKFNFTFVTATELRKAVSARQVYVCSDHVCSHLQGG